MIFSIFVRNVNVVKHMSNEYVIVFMYFFEKKNNVFVRAMIIKKNHLIDNLKINMLIDIDLIESKKMNINIFNKTIYIINCDVIVSFDVRTFRIIVQISIHVRKIIIISSRLMISLLIHYITIFVNRDFLFESKKLIFFMLI